MAGSPILKVFDSNGRYIASCKFLEDAAVLANFRGTDSKVKLGHNGITLWTEGYEGVSASESFDHAAEIMRKRWEAHRDIGSLRLPGK